MEQAGSLRKGPEWESEQRDECPASLCMGWSSFGSSQNSPEPGVSQLSNGGANTAQDVKATWVTVKAQPQREQPVTILMKTNRQCVLRICRVSC